MLLLSLFHLQLGNFKQNANGGIKIIFNDTHRGGYYEGNTRLAFALKIGGAYLIAIKFGITKFMKDVFENLTQISENIEGRIFDTYGSANSTIDIAYKGSRYYKNPCFKDIEIESKYLPFDLSNDTKETTK